MSQDRLKELRAAGQKIGDEISRIETAEVRETNRPLIGKTFKRPNQYSDGKSWWQYAKVTRMDRFGMLFAFTFETDQYGNVSMQRDQCIYHAQYYTPIPARQFANARAKLLARLRTEISR